MKTGRERMERHGEAIRIVAAELMPYGFEVKDHGMEMDEGLADLVSTQDDTLSLMLRYRPDVLAVAPGVRAVLCEVKCSNRAFSEKWVMEARAYHALQHWNRGQAKAAIIRHTFGDQRTHAAWFSFWDDPETVIVPMDGGRDWEQDITTMQALFPFSHVKPVNYRGNGSGTPYVFLDGSHFMPLEHWVADVLGHTREAHPLLERGGQAWGTWRKRRAS